MSLDYLLFAPRGVHVLFSDEMSGLRCGTERDLLASKKRDHFRSFLRHLDVPVVTCRSTTSSMRLPRSGTKAVIRMCMSPSTPHVHATTVLSHLSSFIWAFCILPSALLRILAGLHWHMAVARCRTDDNQKTCSLAAYLCTTLLQSSR